MGEVERVMIMVTATTHVYERMLGDVRAEQEL